MRVFEIWDTTDSRESPLVRFQFDGDLTDTEARTEAIAKVTTLIARLQDPTGLEVRAGLLVPPQQVREWRRVSER